MRGPGHPLGRLVAPFITCVEDIDRRRANMRTARLLVDHVLGCHVPVIAAVNGPAVGLGRSIAVSCDIVAKQPVVPHDRARSGPDSTDDFADN